MSSSHRPHPPSRARLQRLRQEGKVPRSATLRSAVITATALALLLGCWSTLSAELKHLLEECLRRQDVTPSLVRLLGLAALLVLLPAMMGVLTSLIETRGLMHSGALGLKIAQLRPGVRLRRLFSRDGLMDLALRVGTLIALLHILLSLTKALLHPAIALLDQTSTALPIGQTDRFLSNAARGTTALLLVLLLHGGLDAWWQRVSFRRQHAMGHQDLREEHRQQEGAPEQRAALDRARRELLARPPMKRLDEATVIVRNPTHLCIALRYDPGRDRAPMVLVSGQGEEARRLVGRARRRGIPEVQDRPLARELIRVPEGEEVPGELFEALAAIIGWALEVRSEAQRSSGLSM